MSARGNLDALRLVVGWVVLVLWTISVIATAFIRGYSPPPTVHLAMMVVVGALFGPTITGRGRHGSRRS